MTVAAMTDTIRAFLGSDWRIMVLEWGDYWRCMGYGGRKRASNVCLCKDVAQVED